jgi:hypothetical protein
MADVSVEFGAKDTGLEQTLKTVQAQLTSLEDEVKSGTLSFDELQQTMRKIAQAEKVEAQLQAMAEGMTDAGDAASGAAPQIDDSADSMDEVGDSATDAGEKSEMGFLQMAAAVAAGQAAVELAMGAIKGAIDGVVGMFDKFGEALNKGAELDVLSSRTGVASGELSRLGRALENTGASSDMLGPIFDRMNRALAGSGEDGGKAGEALSKLGINIEHLKTLSPDQQFELIGKSLSNVADRSERVDMAMDIFGRGSGSRLLRLFNDYEGTMAQVDRQLGTFPSIMDAMSASFESASTEINAAKEKMVEFATGILSRVMPAIESIAMGLASIDAAALGQKLADAFTGGIEAMQGFQAAIDAIKLGEFGKAFELIFESIKLQAMQTANEIYKNLTAAFQTAGQMIQAIFSSDSATMKFIESSFFIIGQKAAMAFGEAVLSIIPKMRMFDGIRANLEENLQGMKDASFHNFRVMKNQGVEAMSEIGHVLGQAPQAFKQNLEGASPIFTNLEEQSKKVAELQAEIAKKMEETNEKIQSKVISEEEAAEEAKKYFEEYQNGMAAIDGATSSTNKLTVETRATKEEVQKIKTVLDMINETDAAKPMKSFKEETDETRGRLGRLRDFIGQDLSNMTLNDILDKLGIKHDKLDKSEVKLEQIKRAVTALEEADPADLTPKVDVDKPNAQINAVKGYLDTLTGIDATPYLDREAFGEGVNWSKNSIESALGKVESKVEPKVEKSQIDEVKNSIADDLQKIPATVDLDAAASIGKIREDLKEQIDVAIQSSKGTEHLSSIDKLVTKIEQLVNKISEKLPMQALAY